MNQELGKYGRPFYTKSFEQTQELGANIAGEIQHVQVIALHGDLGSGKTTFMQGFAKGLGLRKKIISPTFVIMRTYIIPEKERKKTKKQQLYHIDLYRIEDEKEIEGMGFLELMKDQKNILAIEWPEKIETLLPKKTMHIYFEYIDENTRKITLV